MKIGIFTDTYPPFINGVSTSVQMLQEKLTEMGHEVYIVTLNPDDMKYRFELDGKVIRIPGFKTGIFDYRLTSCYPIKAAEYIKKLDLDVIHSQTEFSMGIFARVLAKQLDIPIVHTYHTMYEDYAHYITHGHFNENTKKAIGYFTKFFCDKTIEELIVPTYKTYNYFKKKYNYERNVHIVPTGIEIERFDRSKIKKEEIDKLKSSLGIKKSDKVLLTLGRVAYEKSLDILIKNMKEILKQKENTKLVIVGTGPQLDEYKNLVKKLNLEENVIFTGKVPWDITPLYYSIADIFVMASHTETQGLTVVEAMSSSVPVVAYLDDAFSNVVMPDLTGYLFKTNKEYVNYVLDLLNDSKKAKRMGEQGKINAEAYSSKYFAERILKVYELAIKDKGDVDRSFKGRVKKVVEEGLKGK